MPNSMTAFEKALDAGYGIELDVHLLKDGNLAVIHDAALMRTTGAEGYIEDLATEDLKKYRLEGTEETIPEFQQVLDLFAGKAPIIVELKAERGNHAALTETACRMLENYPGVYCMESFDPRCIFWLKKNKPEILRGQLAENYFHSKHIPLPFYLRLLLTNHMMNFLSRPDFVSYKFADRTHFATRLCRKLWRIQGVTWTIKSPAALESANAEGWISIFEGFKP